MKHETLDQRAKIHHQACQTSDNNNTAVLSKSMTFKNIRVMGRKPLRPTHPLFSSH